ncbi:hypothetical protein GCM10022404_13770 [Celeribacter arenosi]|uniref:Uncharacterized protein n=2 Tax=Celeribacter arenosi TaxID=792649 RepID=A0ABP7K3M5_9RHOB
MVYKLFIEPVHPANKFDADFGPNGADCCRTVRIDQTLLPKNGLFIWWNPIDAQET